MDAIEIFRSFENFHNFIHKYHLKTKYFLMSNITFFIQIKNNTNFKIKIIYDFFIFFIQFFSLS